MDVKPDLEQGFGDDWKVNSFDKNDKNNNNTDNNTNDATTPAPGTLPSTDPDKEALPHQASSKIAPMAPGESQEPKENAAEEPSNNSSRMSYISSLFQRKNNAGIEQHLEVSSASDNDHPQNGGLNTYGSYEPSWLIGMEYPVNLGIIEVISSGWLRHTDLYGWGFQYTAVWFKPLSDKISFTGFADIWNDGQTTVWMSEPQLWYSLGKLSVGGEVEISQNFVYGAGEDIQIMPTLGLKWEF